MGRPQRKFIDCKIHLGKEVSLSKRIKLASTIMTSEALKNSLSDKLVPLYWVDEHASTVEIGYIIDYKAKLITRSIGTTSCYVFTDFVLTTDDEFILEMAKKHINPHKNTYRMIPIDIDNLAKGIIMDFGV